VGRKKLKENERDIKTLKLSSGYKVTIEKSTIYSLGYLVMYFLYLFCKITQQFEISQFQTVLHY
jgi:hypothetical protein